MSTNSNILKSILQEEISVEAINVPEKKNFWEPNDEKTKIFINKKILELGSVKSVNDFYRDDSLICKYAKNIASEVLN
ncbi:MAG: hypothetical protein JRG68_02165 [Deltaproteobacteria bacterium]|nr:hypothetical protein [Deltaproteobacteria bacterium]MBW2099561.1 hypothetical protein [Deltaproteobacteria bacterium]